MDHRLLEVLACPVCHGKLRWDQSRQWLVCRVDRLAFPVQDDIPVLLENQARTLTQAELEAL